MKKQSIQEKLGLPAETPYVEATSHHPDPFFSHPLTVRVTLDDFKEAHRASLAAKKAGDDVHEVCGISCAMKNSGNVVAVYTTTRAAYLGRIHPGIRKLVISKHHLSAKSMRFVKAFDGLVAKGFEPEAAWRKISKGKRLFVDLIPLARTHTTAHRKKARGTGKPRAHGHVQRKPKRPEFLRSRLVRGRPGLTRAAAT